MANAKWLIVIKAVLDLGMSAGAFANHNWRAGVVFLTYAAVDAGSLLII